MPPVKEYGFSEEKFAKKDVRSYLTELGAYVFMPVQTGYGVATLDMLTCVPVTITPEMVGRRIGVFVSVETKRRGKGVTARQKLIAGAMQDAGAVTVLAYEASDVQKALVEARLLVAPTTNVNKCPACQRVFTDGETCVMGGCPMGGDF